MSRAGLRSVFTSVVTKEEELHFSPTLHETDIAGTGKPELCN